MRSAQLRKRDLAGDRRYAVDSVELFDGIQKLRSSLHCSWFLFWREK
jgi:hypothetical protein